MCSFTQRVTYSGGWKCALVGVPWQGSVSARLAWGDVVSFSMLSNVLKMLNILRRKGTPMRAHLQLTDNIQLRTASVTKWSHLAVSSDASLSSSRRDASNTNNHANANDINHANTNITTKIMLDARRQPSVGVLPLRPIFLLASSLLRLLHSNSPGTSRWAWEFPP